MSFIGRMDSLLESSEVPPHARSRYVIGGYRPLKPVTFFETLLQMHNETLNIWSHLAGALWMLLHIRTTLTTPAKDGTAAVFILIFQFAALLCFSLSTIAHAFGGIVASSSTSSRLWMWDLVGIVMLISGSFVPGLRWAFRCHPAIQMTYTVMVIFLSVILLLLADGRPGTWRRRLFPVLAGVNISLGFVALLHWCTLSPVREQRVFLPMTLSMFAYYMLGFMFWKVSPLERAWPGRFDYLGSHFLWHCLIIVAVMQWDHACQELMKRSWACAPANDTLDDAHLLMIH